MSTVANDDPTRCLEIPTLLSFLSNHLILQNTAPYLTPRDRLALAASSKSFRDLLYHTPGVFRHLDLTPVRSAQFDIDPIDNGGEVWRNVQLDENLTEDDFYGGPLRGIVSTLRRANILRDVQTLILDGLAVTADFCHEVIVDPHNIYSVRILSVRDAKYLNESKLRGSLKYACRPTRPARTPKLRGLYIFSPRDSATTSRLKTVPVRENLRRETEDDWYETKGRLVARDPSPEWAEAMVDCRGVVGFDAALCTGPAHLNSPAFGAVARSSSNGPLPPQWAVGTFALRPCEECGSAPEGVTTYHRDAEPGHLPLLTPVPNLSSSLRAATCPSSAAENLGFVARCKDCLSGRYCQACHRWWCEACYEGEAATGNAIQDIENSKVPTSRSCFECGFTCSECIGRTQKRCSACHGAYCTVHHEGSSDTLCDWCSSRKRVVSAASVRVSIRYLPQEKAPAQTKVAWLAWMRQQQQAGPGRAAMREQQRMFASHHDRRHCTRCPV